MTFKVIQGHWIWHKWIGHMILYEMLFYSALESRHESTWARDDLSSAGWDLMPLKYRPKFDVSNHTHNEDMKSSGKCTNWGNLGQLEVTQGQ